MAEKRLFKELKQLVAHHPLQANRQIVQLGPVDEENSIFKWLATIAKPSRDDNPYYYNGQWKLDIVADRSYPIQPPKISFSKLTPINHPNVNVDTGEICLDILKSDAWSPAWNLEHLVLAILMLIDSPEPDSPLNVDLANLFRHDKQAFELVVQYTMWKKNTLYEGTSDISGVKTWSILAYDISGEEEDDELEEKSEGSENGESHGRNSRRISRHNSNLSRQRTAESCEHTPVSTLSNVDIIQSLGEEVKNELIKKATEVEARSPVPQSPPAAAATHEKVRENVSKQVDEIFLNSARNRNTPKAKESDKVVEKVEEQFLRHIDDQVNEIRKLHEHQRTVVK